MACVFPQLPPELAEKIVVCLDPNEMPSFRLVNKAAAEQFRSPQHTTFRLSRPVPPHAFASHWLAPGATRGMNLWRRRHLLRVTAASGVVANLEVAVQAAGCMPTYEVFEAAAAAGKLDSCQWLLDQNCPKTRGKSEGSGLLDVAAERGHWHVCEWLRGLGIAWSSGGAGAAARGGHVGLMEWLLARRPQLDVRLSSQEEAKDLFAGVAHGCDLPTLQRMWERWRELDDGIKRESLAAAAGSPTPDWVDKVEWLEAQGCRRSVLAGACAARTSDAAARLAWLQERGYRLDVTALEAAAGTGGAAALRYLLAEAGVSVSGQKQENIMYTVCEGGRLEALRELHAAGWPLNNARCALCAARLGHLHVLAWLEETLGAGALGIGRGIFTAAARYSGSVEVLAWLVDRGCEWGPYDINAAAKSGCEEAVEWLVARAGAVEIAGSPFMDPCRNGDLAMARLLRRLGVPWGPDGEAVSDAARDAPLPMLRWLLEEGCPVGDYGAARAAAQERNSGRAEALELLWAHWQAQQEAGAVVA
ncbi:hypothetical protein GPECTOR_51g688 [Gonium pectorale]|uniref:F-box domain-containing protein n=1 Tax=Gonium pectorale TaxID=33097 RepID=A0A150G7G0_GONPE|nr:hypothetical protein GPECTOR_51g688 [Gonium pectorale]|eukprot:KXZ45703.1 hypothetical protein GPECTOR_51g688 [Gonium pectorale]